MITDPVEEVTKNTENISEKDLVIIEKLNCMCEYVISRFDLIDEKDEIADSEDFMKYITHLSEGPGKCLELQHDITRYFESRL